MLSIAWKSNALLSSTWRQSSPHSCVRLFVRSFSRWSDPFWHFYFAPYSTTRTEASSSSSAAAANAMAKQHITSRCLNNKLDLCLLSVKCRIRNANPFLYLYHFSICLAEEGCFVYVYPCCERMTDDVKTHRKKDSKKRRRVSTINSKRYDKC